MRDKILDWWEVSYPNLRHIGEQGTCDLLIKYCNIFVCVCVIVSTSKKILLCSTTRHDANDLMTSLSVNKEHLCKRADWLLTPCIFVCVCLIDVINTACILCSWIDWISCLFPPRKCDFYTNMNTCIFTCILHVMYITCMFVHW